MMASKISWSKRPHFSIEGLEVAPANGLEVAFDNSPEIVTNQWNEQKRNVAVWRSGEINWRREAFGVPILWIVIGIMAFVVGIATGGIVVSAISSKVSRAGSSHLPIASPSQTSSRSTFSDPFITTPGVPLNAAQTFLPGVATSTTSGGVATDTNFQAFTGALGGKAADPVTASGDPSLPYEVDGSTFSDLSIALQRSCNNQHNECAQFANANGDAGGVTIGECDTQQAQCVAALSSAATQSAFLATVT